MMMKALSIAALFTLGVAGTACSQANETAPEDSTAETEQVDATEAAPEVSGSFNLGLPTETAAAPNVGGSFNLGLPTDAPASTAGFNLGTEVAASNGLSDLPEIEAPIDAEDAAETDEDDEPIIRLE
ncbi:MAG: hypothetical protein AAGA89_08120 [Pseudomonadota bacterium]